MDVHLVFPLLHHSLQLQLLHHSGNVRWVGEPSRSLGNLGLVVNPIPNQHVLARSGERLTNCECQFSLECLYEQSEDSGPLGTRRQVSGDSTAEVLLAVFKETVLEVVADHPGAAIAKSLALPVRVRKKSPTHCARRHIPNSHSIAYEADRAFQEWRG